MTTIAWDGKTLAVDSQETADGIVLSNSAKKLHLNIGPYDAVACCGSCCDIYSYIDHLKDPESVKKPDGDYGAIAIKKNRAFQIYGQSSAIREIKGKTADGSGYAVALAAMHSGKGSIGALKIAKKLDVYTGGKIHSFTVKKNQ